MTKKKPKDQSIRERLERTMVAMSLEEGESGDVIISRFRREAARQGWNKAEIEELITDADSANYDRLFNTISKHVHSAR